MSYANIVHSNSPSQYGVVYVHGAVSKKIMYCIFKNNQNYLFYVNGGSLEVSHSFIDHDSKRDHQKNHHHDYVSSPYVF